MADLSIVKSEPLRLVSSQPLPAEQGFVPAAKAALQTAGQFAKGIGGMAWHAMESVAGDDTDLRKDAADAVKAQDEQWDKAKAAWQRGDKTEAFGHLLAAGIPLIGPAAAHAGERIGGELQYDAQGHPTGVVRQPDPSGGIGEAVVNAGAPLAGEVIRRAPAVASRVGEAVSGSAPVAVAKGAVVGTAKAIPGALETSALKYTGVPQLARGAIAGIKAELAKRAATTDTPSATPAIPEPPAPTPQPPVAPSAEISAADVARMQPAEFAKLPVKQQKAAQATADALNSMMQNADGAGPVESLSVGTGQQPVSSAAPAAIESAPQASGPLARPAQPVAPQPGTPASAVAQQFPARTAGAPVQMPSVASDAPSPQAASPVPNTKPNGIGSLPASEVSKLSPKQIAQLLHDEMTSSGTLTEAPSEPVNPFETSARTVKAKQLADFLHQGGISVEDAKLMDASHWKLVSDGLGIKAPSEATISEAVNQLEGMQKASSFGTGKPSVSPATPVATEDARVPNGSGAKPPAPQPAPAKQPISLMDMARKDGDRGAAMHSWPGYTDPAQAPFYTMRAKFWRNISSGQSFDEAFGALDKEWREYAIAKNRGTNNPHRWVSPDMATADIPFLKAMVEKPQAEAPAPASAPVATEAAPRQAASPVPKTRNRK